MYTSNSRHQEEQIEIAHRIKNGDIIIKSTDQPTRDQLYTNQVNLENKSIKDMVSTMKHQYNSLNLYHLTPKDYFTKSEKSARPLPIRKSLLILVVL